MRKRLIFSILIALTLLLGQVTIVLATIDPPSDTPVVSQIKANRNLLASGDELIYGEYSIPYTIPPDEYGADETYILRLLDDSTEIAQVVPYVLVDNGYNKGVFSFYLTDNSTWGEELTIRISQNPAHFTTPLSYDYQIPLTAYTTATSQESNQTLLAINVLASAGRMQSYYTGYTFKESGAAGTVLANPTGETYFRGAIFGIQIMAPNLFLVQTLEIDTTDSSWTTDKFDEYGERFDETWVGGNVTATGTEFGMTPSALMGFIFILPLCIGAIIVSAIKFRKPEPGLMAAALFLIMGALMSWFPMALFASIYQLCGIYLAWVIMGSRG